jgi:uncharacterized protein (DUF1697 family)
MNRYVAFLRGMNLGGRRIKNDELRAEFEALGLAEVDCFRASGNVVFGSDNGDGSVLTEQIESGLREALGYVVPVFLRGAAELRDVAAHEPFDARTLSGSKGKLQVSFLAEAPSSASREQALAQGNDDDRLAIEGRELYWLPSGGMSESDLDLKALASILGPTTIRTKGTVERIAAKYFAG